MFEYFKKLLAVAEELGTVDNTSLYKGYITANGKTKDGKMFSLTLDITEVEEKYSV